MALTKWKPPSYYGGDGRMVADAQQKRCVVKKSHIVVVALLLVLCILSIALTLGFGLPNLGGAQKSAQSPLESAPPPSAAPLRRFKHAAIASDATECAEIGKQILVRNGSAVDAAIAAMVCVGVVNTQSAGIGGGFLMTAYDRASGEASALVAREAAPAAAHQDMFNDAPMEAQDGWRAIAVPGEVAGYWAAHQKYGKLPWKELFLPTIELCREGYEMNQHQSKNLAKYAEDLRKDETVRSVFFNATTGEPYVEGDLIRRPKLADTLQAIADGGAESLHGGEVGKLMVEDIQENGGIVTLEDLKNYKVRWLEPATSSLSDGTVLYSVPPPGSGSLLTFFFNIIDGYNYQKNPPNTNEELDLMYHRIAEAFKYTYARRTELADPEFVDIAELMQNLTSPEYARSIRELIRDDRTFHDERHYGAKVSPVQDAGTAHVSVIDRYGNAASLTSTVNLYFGAKVISGRTGILLNNEMDDFSIPGVKNYFGLPPSPSNFIKPGKMMVSSMCPAIFVDSDGDVRLVTGAAGGSKITSAIAFTAIRHFFLGEDVKQANDFPRLHHQLLPMILKYNEGFPPTSLAYLSSQGHNVEVGGKSAVVALSDRNGVIEGNVDFRKGAGDVSGF